MTPTAKALDALIQSLDSALEAQHDHALLHMDQSDSIIPALQGALAAFGQLTDIACAPELVLMLNSASEMHHRAAMVGLLALGPESISSLDMILCDAQKSMALRERAAQVMFFMTDRWAFERIFEVLTHEHLITLLGQWIDFGPTPFDEDAGGRVLLTLGDEIESYCLDIAQTAMQTFDASPTLDYGLVSMLSAWQTDDALAAIRQCMQRGIEDRAWFAVVERGLWSMCRWDVDRVLNDLLSWLDGPHHQTASFALTHFAPDSINAVAGVAQKWANDEERRYHRLAAIRVLTRSEATQSTDALTNLMDDEDIMVRHMSWYALARRNHGLDALAQYAQSEDELDRIEATEAIAQSHDSRVPQVLTLLAQTRQDEDEREDVLYLLNQWRYDHQP